MEQEREVSKSHARSHAYPAYTIQSSIDVVTKIYTRLGNVNYVNREDIGKVLGLSAGGIKIPLSTATQYNLLEMKPSAGYKPTSLFIKIYKPLGEEERRSAMLECLQSPKLYQTLISEYNEQVLPNIIGLSTQLFRKHSIAENASEKAAKVFIDNLRALNVLTNDNILNLNSIIGTAKPQLDNEDTDEENESEIVIYQPRNVNGAQEQKGAEEKKYATAYYENSKAFEIPVPYSNGTTGKIVLYEGYTTEDLDKVIKIAELYKIIK